MSPEQTEKLAAEARQRLAYYDQAVEVVLKNRKASISLVQRHLKIGYNRAARLVEDMEKAGLVSAMSTNGQRDILVPARNVNRAAAQQLRRMREMLAAKT
jgi:DNA segregation ATPase FtsK/SpoIIIE-like protein